MEDNRDAAVVVLLFAEKFPGCSSWRAPPGA